MLWHQNVSGDKSLVSRVQCLKVSMFQGFRAETAKRETAPKVRETL
jgi:hypothetical protein